MLKKCFLLIPICGMFSLPSFGAESDTELIQRAESYYTAVKTVCSGLSDSISNVSGVAKANTAVNAVGTAASGGALAVGIAKANVDKEIDKLRDELCAMGACKAESIENLSDDQVLKVADKLVKISDLKNQIQDETKRSKTLGNWRTGLMAGNVATNVASAIIAGVNRDKSDLVQQIQACNEAVKNSAIIKQELQRAGINPLKNPIMQKMDSVNTWCGKLNAADVEQIENKMTAVMGTSIAGAVVGGAGVAVSASANSDKIRDGDKEKALNTTANVLSGANVATGLVGVGLNVSMISTAKNMIKQSELCEEVLK